MYMKKTGPNNRLIKKEKNQTIWSTNFKEDTRRKPTGFVINSVLLSCKSKRLLKIVETSSLYFL